MPRAAALIPTATVALYLAHAMVFGAYLADDAGISLAYARNVVAGFGPVLYPGAAAVEGFSNPLWTILMGIGVALRLDGADGIPLLKAMGLCTGALVLIATLRLRRMVYPEDEVVVWLAPALLAVWTGFVFWSGAGLENPLYALLLLAATALQLSEIQKGGGAWSALVLAAAALTRPEGIAFVIPFLLHRIVFLRRVSDTARWTLCALAPVVIAVVIRYVIFGDVVPNTYHAKIYDRSLSDLPLYLISPEDPGFAYVRGFVVASLAAILLACVGLTDRRAARTNLLIAGVVGGMALYVVYVGGDFWSDWRFLTGIMPLVALAAQHGVHVLARQRRRIAVALATFVFAATAASSTVRSLELRRQCVTGWFPSLQGRLEQGRRVLSLARQYGIQDPLYLDPDIGGPSLLGLRVLDLAGLTDLHIARFKYYPPFFRDYIFNERRPEIIRTHGPWTRSSNLTEFPEFRALYAPIRQYEDKDGVHGEFIRRDLLDGGAPAASEPRVQPSLQQAIADQRAWRAREEAREQAGWIEYYTDNGYFAKLRRGFEAHRAAGTLPTGRDRLTRLYQGLIAAGDAEGAETVRRELANVR